MVILPRLKQLQIFYLETSMGKSSWKLTPENSKLNVDLASLTY